MLIQVIFGDQYPTVTEGVSHPHAIDETKLFQTFHQELCLSFLAGAKRFEVNDQERAAALVLLGSFPSEVLLELTRDLASSLAPQELAILDFSSALTKALAYHPLLAGKKAETTWVKPVIDAVLVKMLTNELQHLRNDTTAKGFATAELERQINHRLQEYHRLSHDLVLKSIINKNLLIGSTITTTSGNVHIGDNIYPPKPLQQLPKGIQFLDEQSNLGQRNILKRKFNDYLSENVLPYVSRDEFKHLHPELEKFPTESDILAELLIEDPEKSFFNGCIIYGEGGTGKTRLMLELAQRAIKKGWQVLKISRSAKDLEALKPQLKAGGKYVLIFDYIEESTSTFSIDINDSLENSDILIRVIANCRNTYRYDNEFLVQETYYPVPLLRDNEAQKTYEAYVIKQILKNTKAQFVENSEFHFLRLSFAVFLKFLIDRKKLDSYDVRKFPNFRTWITSRMQLTFGDEFKNLLHETIYLMTILPAREEKYRELRKAYRTIVEKLTLDGWIEEIKVKEDDGSETRELTVIHDTIIDELLIIHLDVPLSSLYGRLEPTIEFAIKHQQLQSWLVSFERITDHLQDKEPLIRLMQEHVSAFVGMEYKLAVTSLFNEFDRIRFFYKNREIFGDYLRSRNFALPLAYMQNTLSKEVKENRPADVLRMITDINATWISHNQELNTDYQLAIRILSTSIKLFGYERFADQVDLFFQRSFAPSEASYIICACLETIGPGQKKVNDYIFDKYLKYNTTVKQTRYVIQTWLNVGGNRDVIWPSIKKFIEFNSISNGFYVIISAWLTAGGEAAPLVDILKKYLDKKSDAFDLATVLFSWMEFNFPLPDVQPSLQKYLSLFPDHDKVHLILSSWLKSGGEKSFIENAFLNVMKQGDIPLNGYAHLLQAWLKANGDYKLIKPSVGQFLNLNHDKPGSYLTIKFWLDEAIDHNWIQAYFEKFVTYHSLANESIYLIFSWLGNGGSIGVVKKYIEERLRKCPDSKETYKVLLPWLTNGGEKELVREVIRPMKTQNYLSLECCYLLHSWLEGTDKKEHLFVTDLVQRFLLQHAEKKEATYVIQSWLKAKGDVEIVKEGLEKILKCFPDEQDISFVIQPWLAAGGDKGVVKAALKNYLQNFGQDKNTAFVIRSWLDAGGEAALVKDTIHCYLQSFAGEPEAYFIIQPWITNTGDFDFIEPFLKKYLNSIQQDKNNKIYLGLLKNKVFKNKEWLKHHLEDYLQNYSTEHFSTSFFKAWYSNDGDHEFLRPYFVKFIASNFKGNESLLSRVLKKEQDPKLVEDILEECLKEGKKVTLSTVLGKENLKTPALKWIKERLSSDSAITEKTGLLLEAWLEQNLPPSYLEPLIYEYLQQYGTEVQSSYIIHYWLDKVENIQGITKFIVPFLEVRAPDEEARFVLSSWIKKTSQIALVEQFFFQYLEKHYANPGSNFVYNSWIGAGGDFTKINAYLTRFFEEQEPSFSDKYIFENIISANIPLDKNIQQWIENWLEVFGDNKDEEVFYFYQNLLTAANTHQFIRPYLTKWMDKHNQQRDAHYILQKWLDTNEDFTIIQDHLVAWLKKHGENLIAQYTLQKSLARKKAIAVTLPYIITWLKKHLDKENAHHLFQAYFKSPERPPALLPYVIDWLNKHGNNKNAHYLYQAYFNSQERPPELLPYVIAWLDKNGIQKDARHLLQVFVNSIQKPPETLHYITAWLDKHGADEDAHYLLQACLNARQSLQEEYRPYLIRWFKENKDKEVVIFLLQKWMTYEKDVCTCWPFVEDWLKANSANYSLPFIIECWLEEGGSLSEVMPYFSLWLKDRKGSSNAFILLRAWLKNSPSTTDIKPYLFHWISVNGAVYQNDVIALLQLWILRENESEVIQTFMKEWFKQNTNHPQALTLFQTWREKTGSFAPFDQEMEQWSINYYNLSAGDSE